MVSGRAGAGRAGASGARRSERGAQERDAAAKASRRLLAQEAPGGRALLTTRAVPRARSPGRFLRSGEEGRVAAVWRVEPAWRC